MILKSNNLGLDLRVLVILMKHLNVVNPISL
jgi:hypothetical protein